MTSKIKYVILSVSILIATISAYFSIFGLSQLFAGASTAVIIMATGLEIGKIITTTALHIYWKKISSLLKFYLSISVLILMMITSVGIYGFLSNAYQKTANKLEIHDGEISVFEGKKMLYENNISDNQKIIEQKSKRLNQLTELRNNQEIRLDAATNNSNRVNARRDIQTSNVEIQKLSDEMDLLVSKNTILNDSINKYNTMILQLKVGSDVAGEVGPLKYISQILNIPMANVVNYLILLLIFVFDPLAVALILISSRIFELEGKQKPVFREENVVVVKKNDLEDDTKEEPLMLDEQHDDEVESKTESVAVEMDKPNIEDDVNKIKLEDIKEIKNRGFSVNIPNKSNVVERIGTNKFLKDNNTVFYKKNK